MRGRWASRTVVGATVAACAFAATAAAEIHRRPRPDLDQAEARQTEANFRFGDVIIDARGRTLVAGQTGGD